MKIRPLPFLCAVLLSLAGAAQAQHLTWNILGQRDAVYLYGEIAVLATSPSIYYCGANWHPGEPAGGYCGIQDNSPTRRSTIFSIWDTAPQLHPVTTEADPQVNVRRFGGEGQGGHTDMLLDWKTGETFRFIVTKQPGSAADSTDARYYIFDRATGQWRHLATITSPNGGKGSVATISGGLNSFLENYLGKDRDIPRLATYRLWLGRTATDMKCLTKAAGDGTWGELNDCYFLATGDRTKLDALLASLEPKYGKAVFGVTGKPLPPIPDRPIPQDVIPTISHPPVAPKVQPAASPLPH